MKTVRYVEPRDEKETQSSKFADRCRTLFLCMNSLSVGCSGKELSTGSTVLFSQANDEQLIKFSEASKGR